MTRDLNASTDALKRLVEESAAAQCESIAAQTDEEYHNIVKRAHQEARRRVHNAVEHERHEEQHRVERLRAELDNHDRQHLLETTRHTLARGWLELEEMLVALWQARECRTEWVRNLIATGTEKLPGVQWRIEHPEFLPEDIAAQWNEQIQRHTGAMPEWVANPGIAAGLRIVADGVHLDGTLSGLMADRPALEAWLLDHIEQCMEERNQPSGAEEEDTHG